MPINQVSLPNVQLQGLQNKQHTNIGSVSSNNSFNDMLKTAINDVNNAQVQSDIATEKLAKGENVELHQVMITAQKASITLQAALEIRNKAVEAYQEMMRMQV